MPVRRPTSVGTAELGFTLVELVVAIVILGVLSAIAVPVFSAQRHRAVDSSVRSDVQAAAQQMGRALIETRRYPGTADFQPAASVLPGFTPSSGTTVQVKTNASSSSAATGFCVRGFNPDGTADSASRAFWFDSGLGGLTAETAAAAPTAPGRVC